MGFIRLQLPIQSGGRCRNASWPIRREILNHRYPGVEFLQWPGGPVASAFFQWPHRAAGNGGAQRQPCRSSMNKRERWRKSREASRASATCVSRSKPTIRSARRNGPRKGWIGRSYSRAAAQTTLEATLGNINTPSVWIDPRPGQSYYVVTYYDGKAVADPNSLAGDPGAYRGRQGRAARRIRKGPALGRARRNRAQPAAASGARADANRGPRHRHCCGGVRTKAQGGPSNAHIACSYVGQVQLMRDTFSGLGVAIGLAVMVVCRSWRRNSNPYDCRS